MIIRLYLICIPIFYLLKQETKAMHPMVDIQSPRADKLPISFLSFIHYSIIVLGNTCNEKYYVPRMLDPEDTEPKMAGQEMSSLRPAMSHWVTMTTVRSQE